MNYGLSVDPSDIFLRNDLTLPGKQSFSHFIALMSLISMQCSLWLLINYTELGTCIRALELPAAADRDIKPRMADKNSVVSDE